ncbi:MULTISPECIES: hypothetical protein [Methylomonas]|uniref:hypothetical protein n=1 Tax=Methylomonas TaxID=416 RepID=UPI001231AC70|nr:hypothetical protein [Methylomonas rhizoryzae]
MTVNAVCKLFAACALSVVGASAHSAETAVNAQFTIKALSGYVVQNDVLVNPGVKPPVGKFNAKKAAHCIQATQDSDSFCDIYLDNNDQGVAYLYYDSNRSWRLKTHLDGAVTTLTGNVDPTGAFMMTGVHALSGAQIYAVGKAKLNKGSLTPKSLSGTLYFTSTDIEEFGVIKFRSAGEF